MNPARIPDLGRKLKLVVSKEFMGMPLYNDKMCNPDRVKQKTLYELWLHCCRVGQVLTVEQLIEFQPHAEEQLRVYDRFVDNEGKTTLNKEEYKKYREDMAVQAAKKNKNKKANKAGKMQLK